MAYDKDEPTDISVDLSRPRIVNNFQSIETYISRDHESFNANTSDSGKHKTVTLTKQTSNPPLASNELGFYNKEDVKGVIRPHILELDGGTPYILRPEYALVHSVTASAVSEIEFKDIGSYKAYLLEYINAVPSINSAGLRLQFSNDNGATYKSDKYSYITGYGGTGLTLQSDLVISGAMINSSNAQNSGNISIRGTNAAYYPIVRSEQSGAYKSTQLTIASQIYFGSVEYSTINAFKIYYSSGNIASGTFNLYGLI